MPVRYDENEDLFFIGNKNMPIKNLSGKFAGTTVIFVSAIPA